MTTAPLPSAYLERVLADVRRAHTRYDAVEEDGNDFGSATFGEIVKGALKDGI